MIKVLKPGIEYFLVADLNFIYVVARIFEFLSPEFSRTSLVCSPSPLSQSTLAAKLHSLNKYILLIGWYCQGHS